MAPVNVRYMVEDVDVAVTFYTTYLGFTLLSRTAPAFADVTRGDLMHQFVRMYAPHEAREDTVLFPALRSIVSKQEFGALGEDFEKKEHTLFGEKGFEKFVDRVASIEKTLGIYDLAQFTPKA
jgi:catechol 2,3-dioxygenase-like lactoylglutathione lyase family enzyme